MLMIELRKGEAQYMSIIVDGKECRIPLKFNGHIMILPLYEPTTEELLKLGINWLTPPMVKDHDIHEIWQRSVSCNNDPNLIGLE